MQESSNNSNSMFTSRRPHPNSRSFISTSHAFHHSNTTHDHGQSSPHQIANISHLHETSNLIYGTGVSPAQAERTLISFIKEFEVVNEIDGELISQPIYRNQLADLDLKEIDVFIIQGTHLKQFDRELYYQFVYFPTQLISIFDRVVKNLYDEYILSKEEDEENRIRKAQKKQRLLGSIKGLTESYSLREIDHRQINRLISIKGIIIRCSEVIPEMNAAIFRCCNCQAEVYVQLESSRVYEPKACEVCRLRDTLEIIHNACTFTDKQFIKFQELPELVPEGETPASITILSYGLNVDGLRPGDRVDIVGIFRVQSSKVQRNQFATFSIYHSYVDMLSFSRFQEKTLKILDDHESTIFYSDEDKDLFHKMADSPTIIHDLIKSFAPSIYGHEEVKKGLLTQLFGGSKKDFSAMGRGRFRSDINICLVGDPSTAKSQLLQQVHKISPRGIYTSGRGSSAVGLTANVRKDPESNEFILESGALVLSDLGICCIDQFDKMDHQSRLILLEAMEQQTISIAKAGIVCQLNSRTAILCAANPVNSRYNEKKSVVENINLQPALLSRFDLIYILLDRPSQNIDRVLASHILNLYTDFSEKLVISETFYSKQILSKYITYAKHYVNPALDENSADKLVEAYSEMRKMGNSKKIITATTRQLESLIRISEAFAKMRLSNVVEERDVDEAIALVKFATQQAATDPTTGLIDMDVIVTGKTSSSRMKIKKIKEIAHEIIKGNVGMFKKNSTIDSIKADVERNMEIGQKITDDEIVEGLRLLESEGVIVLYGANKQRPNFRLAKDLHNM